MKYYIGYVTLMRLLSRRINSYRNMSDDEQFRWFAIILGIVLAIDVLAVGIVSFFEPMFDMSNYYGNISDVIDNHLMPYGGFKFEYPPAALLVFAVPKLFSWDLVSFHFSYAIFAALAYVLFARYLLRITDHFGIQRANVYISIIVLAIIGNQFITARNDIFAILAVTVAFYCFTKERYDLSAVALAVGAMIKIYPIILIPMFMIVFLSRRDWVRMFRFAIVSCLVCVIIELPFLIADPSTAFAYLSYHSDRGLQVEGVVSSVITFINLFAPIIDEIGIYYGSNTIVGDIPDMCARILDKALYVMLVVSSLWMIYRCHRMESVDEKQELRILSAMSIIILFVFITFSKVYSAQYMLWFLSLFPLLLLSSDDDRYSKMVRLTALYVLFAVPSSAVAFMIGGLYPEDNVIPILLVLMKNVFHIILFAFIIRSFIEWTSDIDRSC